MHQQEPAHHFDEADDSHYLQNKSTPLFHRRQAIAVVADAGVHEKGEMMYVTRY
jgi:hypothetical protein